MTISNCHILVTGANGFIGKNLLLRLKELSNIIVSTFVRGDDPSLLPQLLVSVDVVIHLAGENRPADEEAFFKVNAELTSVLCNAIQNQYRVMGRHIPLVMISSIQAEHDNPYGRSKLAAEKFTKLLAKETQNSCAILRLPGVFGKWCKPNYNSVVATFSYNIARNLPIQINDPEASIRLVYIDDVITTIFSILEAPKSGYSQVNVEPEYSVKLGELAKQIQVFANSRATLFTESVGKGFLRALYATYMSYLPNDKFSYEIEKFTDQRGEFVEILKTKDSGQFSYFTAYPGVTRGGHYHHTKTEKFLVVKGKALFRFKSLLTNELVELQTDGLRPKVVDTIPGWTHDITNVGDEEMVVMLWANENFDQTKPDTVVCKV